jgi:hypothetical protein
MSGQHVSEECDMVRGARNSTLTSVYLKIPLISPYRLRAMDSAAPAPYKTRLPHMKLTRVCLRD